MKTYKKLKGIKDLTHRDEMYRRRVNRLSTTTTYNAARMQICLPARRSLKVPFNPDDDSHWVYRPDLANLVYAQYCHSDENVPWSISILHRPYECRRARTICSLSLPVRPFLNATRWRQKVDEARFYVIVD